jgi:hypothetical protein
MTKQMLVTKPVSDLEAELRNSNLKRAVAE